MRPVGGDEQDAMNVAEPQPAVPMPSNRWYRRSPDRAVTALLVVEGLL